MSAWALSAVAVLALALALILSATEAAWNYVPRQDLDKALATKPSRAVERIRADISEALVAMTFWRLVAEMGAAVALAFMVRKWVASPVLAVVVLFLALLVLSLIFVGISPRSLGRARPVALVQRSAPLVNALWWLLGPLVPWLQRLGSHMNDDGEREQAPYVTEAEFREIVERASDEDVIEDAEADMIRSVVDAGDTRVREVMVPRTDMVSIPANRTVRQALSLLLRSGFSRVPVIGENTDDILGMLYLKDVAKAHLAGKERQPVTAFMRAVQFVPDSMHIRDLLTQMQQDAKHVAVVVDEYGGTAGLVTLEDVIEEIVGEITDEYDRGQPEDVQRSQDGSYLVSPRLSVNDFAELVGEDIDADDVDTLGGLFAKTLGLVPIMGSAATIGRHRVEAVETEGRRKRVSRLRVSETSEEPNEPGELRPDPDPDTNHKRSESDGTA